MRVSHWNDKVGRPAWIRVSMFPNRVWSFFILEGQMCLRCCVSFCYFIESTNCKVKTSGNDLTFVTTSWGHAIQRTHRAATVPTSKCFLYYHTRIWHMACDTYYVVHVFEYYVLPKLSFVGSWPITFFNEYHAGSIDLGKFYISIQYSNRKCLGLFEWETSQPIQEYYAY